MNGRCWPIGEILEQEPMGCLISRLFQGLQLTPETLHVDLVGSRGH